ncbi:cytosine permease, partial [Bacillus sp. SIMBA_069]
TSSLISIGVGATLFVLGLNLRQLLVATLVGVALSFLPLGVGTLAGKWSGQPTLVVSRASFGIRGNIVPTVLALVVKLFWGS